MARQGAHCTAFPDAMQAQASVQSHPRSHLKRLQRSLGGLCDVLLALPCRSSFCRRRCCCRRSSSPCCSRCRCCCARAASPCRSITAGLVPLATVAHAVAGGGGLAKVAAQQGAAAGGGRRVLQHAPQVGLPVVLKGHHSGLQAQRSGCSTHSVQCMSRQHLAAVAGSHAHGCWACTAVSAHAAPVPQLRCAVLAWRR